MTNKVNHDSKKISNILVQEFSVGTLFCSDQQWNTVGLFWPTRLYLNLKIYKLCMCLCICLYSYLILCCPHFKIWYLEVIKYRKTSLKPTELYWQSIISLWITSSYYWQQRRWYIQLCKEKSSQNLCLIGY